ncbi:beta-galactosidase [Agromyces sp. MMS24-K17]|uniref:beta-galactosidase n=1 Tax=Agromyces sp. MMS24-K17 TaxID=3372850 RepID=UPI003754D538
MKQQFDGEHRRSATEPTTTSHASESHPYRVTVTAPAPVGPAPLDMGDADDVENPIRLTTRSVTRNGKPWIPVMGKYHFSRDRPERWETELRKMRAGGINTVATYLLWILHEETEGDLRWDGHRDVRTFVETADRAGLAVMIRIGPWAHGETRNGGFPDWLQALPIRHRSNDPAYLAHVRRWYTAIEEQVRGLFHSAGNPDGPIIGVQIDNELYDDGPHLATLRDLAEEVGLTASLWTATGWGGAELPRGQVLPVYAGYSDGFWEESDTGWPDFGKLHFTYSTVRDDLSVGADLRETPVDLADGATLGADDPWPYVTCELGGGMAIAYHRRPLVDPDDVAALALAKLGSGSAWQGYYMYHGGTHVFGSHSTTQESHATGYPNDMPVRDYDFAAPLGAMGGERPHFHQLRQQHLMIESFTEALATTATTIPDEADEAAGAPRWAVRSDGRRGFLFANNHQPALAALPPLHDVQFAVEFDDGRITVPTTPITLPSGAYFAWPLRQRFGSIAALTATAQPITAVGTETGHLVVFAAIDGIDVELQLEGVDPADVRGAEVRTAAGIVIATPDTAPGLGCEVHVGDTTLLFLDSATAQSVWRGVVDGRDSLVIWRGAGWFDGGFRIALPEAEATLDAFPPLRGAGLEEIPGEGSIFTRFAVPAGVRATGLAIPEPTEEALAPVRIAGSAGRFSAPTDDDFASLEPLEVRVPVDVLDDAERAILTIDWVGDAIRVYLGGEVITDQFWYGRPLELDLMPYRDALATDPLVLKAFAWAPDSGVHVDERVRPRVTEPTLEFRSVTVTPVRSRSLR